MTANTQKPAAYTARLLIDQYDKALASQIGDTGEPSEAVAATLRAGALLADFVATLYQIKGK